MHGSSGVVVAQDNDHSVGWGVICACNLSECSSTIQLSGSKYNFIDHSE